MAQVVKVIGAKRIMARLKRAHVKMGDQARRGLIKAGLFLLRESKKIVPIETSNLKNSGQTKALGWGWNSSVVVYYTASYAVYVHERTELKHKKGKSAKFLEKPARMYQIRIVRIIAGEVEP